MAFSRTVLPLLVASVPFKFACAIDANQLQGWASSIDGLSLTQADATALAAKEAPILTSSGIDLPILQAMKAALVSIHLDMAGIRQNIMLLVEQHMDPVTITELFSALSSSYTFSGGLGLPQDVAQSNALHMAKIRPDVDQLCAVFKGMYGYFGLGFDVNTAQQIALQQGNAGADADTFSTAYKAAKSSGKSLADCLRMAIDSSVKAFLLGLPQRYCKDGTLADAAEFQRRFGTAWLPEWLLAPLEQRVSEDHHQLTAHQYLERFGGLWEFKFRGSAIATQQRMDVNGTTASMMDFQKQYGGDWQTNWAQAPEFPCVECGPFTDVGYPQAIVV